MDSTKKQTKTLLIVDLQNDFSPEGALPVANFHNIIPGINAIMPYFDAVIATQDWHTPDHVSFYTRFKKAKPFDSRFVNGKEQLLWPVHCVANTWGAQLDTKLDKRYIKTIFKKGKDRDFDAYSAFHLNDGSSTTGLEKLIDPQTTLLFLCGVATNVCVFHTAISAKELGYKTFVIKDLCAGLGPSSEKESFRLLGELPNITLCYKDQVQGLLEKYN